MLKAIEEAERRVQLEMYLLESGAIASRFIDAFVAAAARGVSVHLLLDDFGALGLARSDRQRLRNAGVRLAYYNPLRYTGFSHNLFRNHRKLLMVDDRVAFVGGLGITDPFDEDAMGPSSWHETVVRIEGPILGDWQQVFLRTWNTWSPAPLTLENAPIAQAGTQNGRVALSSGLHRTDIKRALLKRVRNAKVRVWIATAYFIPARRLRNALKSAARKGVDVRLLLAGPRTDHPAVRLAGRRFYAHLLRSGVRIYEYAPRFLHAKVQLCDDWVSLGSSNMDRWNFRWNLEANQEVSDPVFAERLQVWFDGAFQESVEIDYDNWIKRSWWMRAQEKVWGWMDLWMERRSQTRR
jgi:phosphatidylserine/phosphatidylglycerophosphate/cardiolipin synthase-like enzyme